MPGAKNVLSALLNKNVLKQMLKCFPELVSNLQLNQRPCCFYTSMSQVLKKR